MPVIDLLGKKFGKLTVLERDMSKTSGAAYWICKCDCGNIISTRGTSLRDGSKQDCGCINKEKRRNNVDITKYIGQRFGRLVVKERDLTKPIGHGNSSWWICQCDCGNIKSCDITQLKRGNIQSCGCLKTEMLNKRNIKDITNQRFGMVVAKKNTYQKSTHNSYIWQCECDCGNTEYFVSAESLLSGKIHSCGCNTRSYGERKINELLLQNNILFIQEFKFLDSDISKLRYDFAIVDNNYKPIRLIEFDGEQHFKPKECFGGEKAFQIQQQHDMLKNQYAKKKNIPLVRIPYYELNNITLEMIMGDEFLT